MMRDELIINNINLVHYVIQKMHLRHRSDEYFDVGLIGLVKAANSFNSNKGYKFSTMATTCIRNQILHAISKEPKVKPISLDIVVHNEDGHQMVTLLDTIKSDFDIEEHMIKREQYDVLNKALLALTDSELIILKLYYGEQNLSQDEVAVLMGGTQSNISRKIKKIIKKLRKEIMKGYKNE